MFKRGAGSSNLASGRQGMVSSANSLATEAGLAILIYDAAQRESRFLNSSDRIPRGVDSDCFRPPAIDYEANRRGAKAISTPGNGRAWQALSQTNGKLPWAALLERAIDLAQRGFAIGRHLSYYLQRDYALFPTHAQEIYGRNGRPYQAGEMLAQHDLAQAIAQPRISFAEPDQLLVDPALAAETKVKLAAMGHDVQDIGEGPGNAHGLMIDYSKSKQPLPYYGAADRRGEGLAKGL